MSLKTSPYKPANVTADELHPIFNLGEVITFIYPDGATRELKLYEGMFIATMYVRRNASVAIYQMQDGKRALVLEYNDGQLRALPALYDAMQKLLSMVKVEADEAAQRARDSAISAGGSWAAETDAQAPAEASPVEAAQPEEGQPVAADDGDARAGSRFRRGRR